MLVFIVIGLVVAAFIFGLLVGCGSLHSVCWLKSHDWRDVERPGQWGRRCSSCGYVHWWCKSGPH